MSDCKTYACAEERCQATIHLHHDIERRLRRTHETFYCPAGHSNYFPGKTDEERAIERAARLERERDRFLERWQETMEDRDGWKVAAKSCPFECGYRVLRKSKPESIAYTLAMHLVEAHGAVFPTADDLAAVSPADTTEGTG